VSGVWFTSDLHLGHKRVAEIRGYETAEDHDAAIVKAWKRVVTPEDHVWVLGDLSGGSSHGWSHALGVLAGLPGVKHLVSGNHDSCHPMHRDAGRFLRPALDVFSTVQPFARRRIEGQSVLLSHFPYAADRGVPRYTQYRLPDEGMWLLHGHMHSEFINTGRREIHVGLDAWNGRLVNIGRVAEIMRNMT
jgi:calcineurin-like phosphoesterase family protein